MTTQSVTIDAGFIAGVATGLCSLIGEAAIAAKTLEDTKGRQLPFLMASLQGAPKVTAKDWADHWAKPTYDAYMASGRYAIDAKGVSLAARSAVSALKVCVIALTHGIEPGAGDSLFSFTKEARAECARKGLIEGVAKAGSGNKKASARKSPAQAAKAAQTVEAHALAFALNDKALAGKLMACVSDYRVEFETWFDTLVAIKARLAA